MSIYGRLLSSMMLITCLCATSTLYAAPSSPQKATASNDITQLQALWIAYQDQVMLMNKAITHLQTEANESQKLAKISMHIKKLDQIKNALNRLVIAHSTGNVLRQQMLEHATKFQNVYRLATTPKPTEGQLSMAQRLTAQTDLLYQQMQITAQGLL